MSKEYVIDGKVVARWAKKQGGKPYPIFENVGYHYGDLGKARDTNYFSIMSGRRSTGHFGNGTYFFGKKQEENGYFTRKDRPIHKIDFSEYKLYKPKDKEEAYILHEGLKAINNREYNDPYFERLKDMLIKKKKTNIEIYGSLSKVIKEDERISKSSVDIQLESDSPSTIFMKELGYEGIDVRHIEEYDNSTYGSVIYDLHNK